MRALLLELYADIIKLSLNAMSVVAFVQKWAPRVRELADKVE